MNESFTLNRAAFQIFCSKEKKSRTGNFSDHNRDFIKLLVMKLLALRKLISILHEVSEPRHKWV